MNKRIADIEEELKNIAVEPDAFALWKQNSVTRKFLLEVELGMLETQAKTVIHSTIEQIAICEIKRSAHVEALKEFLSWNPIIDSE